MSRVLSYTVLIAALVSLILGSAALSADVTFTPADGGYRVQSANYDVTVLSDGCLSSFIANGEEFLNSKVGYARGAYLHDGNVMSLSGIVQQDNIVTAQSDKASIKYEFSADSVSCTMSNKSQSIINYYIIFDEQDKVVFGGNSEYANTAVNKDWTSATFFHGNSKVKASGAKRLWGPWNGQQVLEVALGPGETQTLVMAAGTVTTDEKPIVSKLALPKELRISDINVLSPREYQVFQRRSRYDGYVVVSGWVRPACDKLQARIIGTSLKGKLPAKWQTIPLVAKTQGFSAQIPTIAGGWYQIELRAMKNGKVIAQAAVEKVGVGEVFVGAGQSNSTNCGQFQTKETSGMVSSFDGYCWQLADDPQPGPHDHTQGGSFWPAFGDAMYTRYHVPIGVAVTGHGGTSVTQWQPDAPDGLYPWMMTRIYQLGPLGFRAVLWHQGENDAQMQTDEYVKKMTTVIRRSNIDAGWEFPWFVAWASYHNVDHPSWPLVRAAQKQLWDDGIALQGPDTDTLTGDNRDYDGNGIHFSPKGLKAHGNMWAEKLSTYIDSVLGPDKK